MQVGPSPAPTAMFSTTALVAGSITLTVPGPAFGTYTWEPSGLSAGKRGWALTPMVAVTVFVAVSITLTVESLTFVT